MTKRLDQLVGASPGPGFSWVVDINSVEGAGHAGEQPLFLRIARAISTDIRRGRLRPGAALPGSRVLAQTLAVHRNTVLAAYRELLAEGFIEPHHGRGTFVSAQLPDVNARAFRGQKSAKKPLHPNTPRAADPIGFAFTSSSQGAPFRTHGKHVLRMYGGWPDLRELPVEALVRAQRRTLRRHPDLLGYGEAAGHPPLRAALANMLAAARGLTLQAEDILVTRGSQMAIALAAACLLRPGDTVVVEAFGYAPAWHALRHTGARIVALPVDAQGLCVDKLAELCERQSVRAVYVTPHHQYPTTVPLSPSRRLALLALAERKRIAILEDDYDHEFHYEGRPLLPLKSADDAGNVIYIGTLSKVFAPGVRIGYVAAPTPLLRDMIARRFYLDRQGEHVTEAALAELIEEGELSRHIRRMRRLYRARRDHCVQLLRAQLGDALTFNVPNGGMALWARAANGIDVARWALAAEQESVVFQSGQQFRWDGKPSQQLRLGFAGLTEPELTEAVRRLVKSLQNVRSQG